MPTVKLSQDRLPIILVRGWGGFTIDDEQRQTHQGFNVGSVYPHKKGPNYIYEGLILRFLKDPVHPYLDATNVIRYNPGEGEDNYVNVDIDNPLISDYQELNTLWVFRYYDFENRKLEFYGEQLREVVRIITDITGAPKVNIIAHSMGGLIVRWMLQNVYESDGQAHAVINKVVTLGTPHGGITIGGAIKRFIPGWEIKYFSRGYLDRKLGGSKQDCQDIKESFNPQAMLCIVGTDHRSYRQNIAGVVSELAVGRKSDGLVKQENAVVKGAFTAYVHKCHSGVDSLVTSREAYELATRFFFGDRLIRLKQHRGEIHGKYERWYFLAGKPEYFIGFSLKPRAVDFFLNQQSKDAENCFGPFSDNKIEKDLDVYVGFLDSARIKSENEQDVVFRLDWYVGERDFYGLGFSDNIVLQKNTVFRYILDMGPLEFFKDSKLQDRSKENMLTLNVESTRNHELIFEQFDVDFVTYNATMSVKLRDLTKAPLKFKVK